MKISKGFWVISVLTLALITGCSSTNQSSSNPSASPSESAQAHTTHAPNGDLQELTASISALPTFLDKVDPTIKDVYAIAGQHNQLLQSIPCYCGCGESAGHMHNGNCFIKEVKEDGSVIWDDHGTRCQACLEIAFISGKMSTEGKSVKEIRDYIDQQYGEGYAKPTPTPMPKG
ncbi:PCYCGC domain-containing protein [Brevibacillus daliensis]|uniref:PCYCGC domain-containing protein n=1 Tax=Brevibacillus daliensis TaxID=2892995 RepID=UPI001E537F77|nr:PCYCGC domain-containing protein [Brevibacillus daliensis]